MPHPSVLRASLKGSSQAVSTTGLSEFLGANILDKLQMAFRHTKSHLQFADDQERECQDCISDLIQNATEIISCVVILVVQSSTPMADHVHPATSCLSGFEIPPSKKIIHSLY